MGKIIATQYISLDGVIEDPVGMENSGLGDWIGPFTRGPEGDKFKDDELRDAVAIMLGRRTYDGFAAVWPTLKSPMADRMNLGAEMRRTANREHDHRAGRRENRKPVVLTSMCVVLTIQFKRQDVEKLLTRRRGISQFGGCQAIGFA